MNDILKDFAIGILATRPLRATLSTINHRAAGRKILNELSFHRRVCSSFEEAWKVAGQRRHPGHDHGDSIRNHFSRTDQHILECDYAPLYWLTRIARSERTLRIADFGGGVGVHYYTFLPYLRDAAESIHWIVCELPYAINTGQKLAVQRRATNIEFVSSCSSVEANTLLAFGSFHYWEKTIPEFFDCFAARPSHLLLRIAVTDAAPTFITVQRTESFAVPCIVRNSVELITSLRRIGYELVDRWPVLEWKLPMPFYPELSIANYSGFYFRRVQEPRL